MEENMEMDNKTRVRFAPSPTGYLHIGSARTALFNWLFAKNTGGDFILRIEDTDLKRHQEDSISQVFRSLKWLGITWDEGPDIGGRFKPYRQSERRDIYNEMALQLLDSKNAYRCFCAPEDLKIQREKAIKDKGYYIYDRRCLELSQEEIESKLKNDKDHAIRFLVPQDKIISFDDFVYGKIEVESKNIEDFIILRSNGLPTYNFSVAVDDITMDITHVIRGEDHISNTPKQLLIYKALGADIPRFVHLPMIMGEDGKKLSKRHGSISIEEYKKEGFLPEAVMNYIALLGWSYDDKTTIFGKNELIEKFSLDKIGKKPARFDYSKLLWINGNYIRELDDKKLSEMVFKRVLSNLEDEDPGHLIVKDKEIIRSIVYEITPVLKIRLKTICEAWGRIKPFFLKIDYSREIKTYFAGKALDPIPVLDACLKKLSSIESSGFSHDKIEQTLRSVSSELDLNFRKVAEVIRLAVWADKVSPPMFDSISILGKNTTLKRLRDYKEIIS